MGMRNPGCSLTGPRAGGSQAAYQRRDLRLEAAEIIAVIDADPRPAQGIAGIHPARERPGRPVAGAARRLGHARVVVAVGIGDRVAGTAETFLAGGFGAAQLFVERIVVERGEPRMRARVRADLPAAA